MKKLVTKALKWDGDFIYDTVETLYNNIVGGNKMGKELINISPDTAIHMVKDVGKGVSKNMNDKTSLTMTIIVSTGVIAALIYKRSTLK